MRSGALALLVVLSVALVACTTSDPTRPKVIAMTDLDPCQVLTEGQLGQLGVPAKPTRTEPASAGNANSADCLWASPSAFDFSRPTRTVFAETVTFLGVDDVFARAIDDKRWITVQGYRALELDKSERPDSPSYQIYVDVHAGQSLNIAGAINDWHGDGQAGKDETRDMVTQAANFAMTTLLAR